MAKNAPAPSGTRELRGWGKVTFTGARRRSGNPLLNLAPSPYWWEQIGSGRSAFPPKPDTLDGVERPHAAQMRRCASRHRQCRKYHPPYYNRVDARSGRRTCADCVEADRQWERIKWRMFAAYDQYPPAVQQLLRLMHDGPPLPPDLADLLFVLADLDAMLADPTANVADAPAEEIQPEPPSPHAEAMGAMRAANEKLVEVNLPSCREQDLLEEISRCLASNGRDVIIKFTDGSEAELTRDEDGQLVEKPVEEAPAVPS